MKFKIPEQLKECRFCKIKKGEKAPFEINWQNKYYNFYLINEYFPEYNYGVLCGHNELGVLDDDTPDKRLMKLFDQNFKDTFQVRGHYYIKLKGWDCKKIIFYDGDEHLGELQGLGTQVVGAGSLHPSGEYYELIKDIPILEIDFKDFERVFGKYIKKQVELSINKNSKIYWDGDDINKIPISNIMSPINYGKCKNPNQGTHPIHGSTTGVNFTINPSNNTWYCFRCNSGGGVWSAIAVSEGIIDCSQAKNYNPTKEEIKRIIKIANEKYGLKFPENQYFKESKILYEFNLKNEFLQIPKKTVEKKTKINKSYIENWY